jgi:hypothetical protein
LGNVKEGNPNMDYANEYVESLEDVCGKMVSVLCDLTGGIDTGYITLDELKADANKAMEAYTKHCLDWENDNS